MVEDFVLPPWASENAGPIQKNRFRFENQEL